MRGYLVSVAVHAGALTGLLLLPSFSASELPPPPAPPVKVFEPFLVRVQPVVASPPRLPRRFSLGGGGAPSTSRAPAPEVVSDEPLPPGGQETEPAGEPGLPPGPGSPFGTELVPAAPDAAPAAPQLVRAHVDVRPPRKLGGADPVYPPMARAIRAGAQVVLECTIGTDGRVRDVRVVKGHPLFDDAAIAGVLSWSYTPTLLNGVPVAVLMTVTVNFTPSR